ncbi:MAG: PspC domain-containing protein [Dethiobacteria bacterium]
MKNRVYRSRKNRVIAGVAGGLGEYFDVDVVIVRILFVLAVFLGGGGLLAYIIAWIVIPEEKIAGEELDSSVEYHEEKNEWDPETRSKRQRNAGFLLIGLGVFLLSRRFLGSFFYYFGPLLLIIIGIFLLVRERREG